MLRRNVLIFQTGGLGDFILTWSFAVALGRIYPQSRIIYVTHQQKGDLARKVLRLEANDIENGWHGLFAKDGKLPATAQSLLEGAHAVYTFLPVTQIWRENVTRISQLAKVVEIDAKLPAAFKGHLTDQILEGLKDHPPERAATQQILRSINDRGIGFKPAGGSDVVIHPGSGSPAKCWPIDRFLELAAELKTSGRTVRFITGEVEEDRWSKEDLNRLSNAATHRRGTNLLELLQEMSTAAVFIGNDSGPGHLAGMIGVPTIALFTSTDSQQWKPLGPRVNILQGDAQRGLQVVDVLKAIRNFK